MKMGKAVVVIGLMQVCVSGAFADLFGSGVNQFEIDFVPISSSTNPPAGVDYGYVGYDYRIGTYEITNQQWNQFQAIYGAPTGYPGTAYDDAPYFTDPNAPTNNVSWYEAAQFVNWLNTSSGYTEAYLFTGTQGMPDYTLDSVGRNSSAYYFLPSEDEWFKAAYWNGTDLQTEATKAGEVLQQGDGISGTGWNYNDGSGPVYDPLPGRPWDVGSGSEELNGTYDMMGNIEEFTDSMYIEGNDAYYGSRSRRGGSYQSGSDALQSPWRRQWFPQSTHEYIGFRVASMGIPEPCSLGLLSLGGLVLLKRRRRA